MPTKEEIDNMKSIFKEGMKLAKKYEKSPEKLTELQETADGFDRVSKRYLKDKEEGEAAEKSFEAGDMEAVEEYLKNTEKEGE